MPRAGFKRAPGIDVVLSEPDAIYIPGDTINGNIIVDAADSLSGAQNHVHIKVYGRAKVLIVQSNGEGKDYYRGRQVLFEKSIYSDGPPSLHGDKESWPFSVQIPTHTVPGEYKMSDVWKKNEKFLDNQEMDISQHPLPGVFYYCGESGSTKGEAYVEYVLEASVRKKREEIDPSGKKKKKEKKFDGPMTIVPLVVRTRSTDRPILYSDHQQDLGYGCRISSMKLLAEFANEKLGFKHSLKKVFQSSKVPNYYFNLKIACPSTIQLDNPSHFPFRLSVVPTKDPTGKSCINENGDTSNLPDVQITSFSLCLKMYVKMRARMLLKWDTSTEKHHEFGISSDLPPGMVGYVIPREDASGAVSNGSSAYRHPDESNKPFTGANDPYLDLGQLLDLRVSRTHSTRIGDERTDFKTKRPLWPSFQSYNMVLWYQWKYKIEIACAGETERVEGKQMVELVGPSEEQEQNIQLDQQGVKRNWKDLLEGAEGAVAYAALATEIAAAVAAEV